MLAGHLSTYRPMRGARLVVAAAALLLTLVGVLALTFPPLTGRIVDQANIISADARSAIEPKLADLEAKSGIQLVVATVNSLEGQEIEPYANELFRAWKLGEKAKNNGVLLLVAPKERRVRIEVGYGLEGTLTDALGKVIITNAITPRFKAGDFSDGISRGIDDIITVLTTDASVPPKPILFSFLTRTFDFEASNVSVKDKHVFTYGGDGVASYPLDIYRGSVRRFFTFVVPLAFVNYEPALFVLGRPDPLGLPDAVRLLSPVAALAMAGVARYGWQFGVRHYQSTGT